MEKHLYVCRMSTTAYVNIIAESADEAQDWLDTHSIEEMLELVPNKNEIEMYFDDEVIEPVDRLSSDYPAHIVLGQDE